MINNIVIFGSGNVATHLAKAFYNININVLQVFSPNIANAQKLAQQVNAQPINTFNKINKNANLYLICISDKEISNLVEQINFEPSIIAHTSGSINICELSKFKNYGVFYPLQTFSKNHQISLQNVPFCIEGNNTFVNNKLFNLALKLSGNVQTMNSETRQYCHLAAVFANNFVNHFYSLAQNILQQKQVPFKLLGPLIIETAQKAALIGPENSQTGPAARGDNNVMLAHKQLLNNQQLEKMYSFVSENIFAESKKHNNK